MTVYFTPDGIQATKGELIEFKRRKLRVKYCHFAVYTFDCDADCQVSDRDCRSERLVGDGITVGVSLLEDSRFPHRPSRYKIMEKTIRELCKNKRRCRVNNLDKAAAEKGLEPFDPDKIVERARFFLRQNLIENYYLLTKNCEHFATKCRYGEEFSCQVNELNPFKKAILSMLGRRGQRDQNLKL
uniref:LRAT domain-containing protein n=1 Tax=Daphnia galeata TaxID=27404 RepID=A0A8J2W3J8_9CRUS|nr:unnamed protein product [Daphnia galeata]